MAGKPGVILVLCGIPASGKTYLANLLKKWSTSTSEPNLHIFHICYDDRIPSNLRLKTQFSNVDEKEDSPWKYYRKLVSRCAERVLMAYTNHNSTQDDIDVPGNIELPCLEDFWRDFIINQTAKERTCCFFQTQNWVDTCHVFLIDDNMYYRSMRHEYYVLARKYSLGYAEVIIECPLEIALKRNSLREQPVEPSTICTMATKLETPWPEKYTWEAHSVTLNQADIGDSSLSNLQQLQTLIRKSAENPVQPIIEEDQELKEESRAAILASVLHQTDKALRRVITDRMVQVKDQGLSKAQMKSKAEQLNTKRKRFLEALKNVAVDNNMTNPIDNQTEPLADSQRTDLSSQLDHLLEPTFCSRDTYTEKCRTLLTMLINKDGFDTAVKYMFENCNHVFGNKQQ